MTTDEEIRRGMEAQRLMSEPLIKGAFADIEAGIVDAMRRCKVGDTGTQHELVLMLQLLTRVQNCFKTHMETGQMAAIQKETLAQKAKRSLMRRMR